MNNTPTELLAVLLCFLLEEREAANWVEVSANSYVTVFPAGF
jgi:hypothetical protein